MSGHDAAIAAMNELLGPIIGITLVLMAVFLPAAFLPGLTGRIYAQFALVIAATALFSAINAVTLKPTQAALWLRPRCRRNGATPSIAASTPSMAASSAAMRRLIRRMVARAGLMTIAALVVIALAGWGLARVPTGFLPIEDQGYLLVVVQLPDGAALARTQKTLDQVSSSPAPIPASSTSSPSPAFPLLDDNAPLANAGVAYVVLKDWSKRARTCARCLAAWRRRSASSTRA